MHPGSQRIFAALLLTLVIFPGFGGTCRADPPARVGRLMLLQGSASLSAAGGPWSPALANYPITSGAALATGEGAVAAVSVGAAALYLDARSEVMIEALDDHRLEATLRRGRMAIRLRSLAQGDRYVIALPGMSAALTTIGAYRLTAGDAARAGEIAVLGGSVIVAGAGSTAWLESGEAAILGANIARPLRLGRAERTLFDAAALAESPRQRLPLERRYVSPDMTGYEDLDTNGSWSVERGYGVVWYPKGLPIDWAPYRHGRWRHVSPWGWTWIAEESWGFAPFHYGRWVKIDERWGWIPGDAARRPVYAPAVVAFLRDGDWLSRAAGDDDAAVGWIPLGPREIFLPAYAASASYLRDINAASTDMAVVASLTAPRGAYANRLAATVIPRRAFTDGVSVAAAALAIPRAELAVAAIAPAGVAPAPAPATAERVSHAPSPGSPLTPQEARLWFPPVARPEAREAATPRPAAEPPVTARRSAPQQRAAIPAKPTMPTSAKPAIAFTFSKTPDPNPPKASPSIPVTRASLDPPSRDQTAARAKPQAE